MVSKSKLWVGEGVASVIIKGLSLTKHLLSGTERLDAVGSRDPGPQPGC